MKIKCLIFTLLFTGYIRLSYSQLSKEQHQKLDSLDIARCTVKGFNPLNIVMVKDSIVLKTRSLLCRNTPTKAFSAKEYFRSDSLSAKKYHAVLVREFDEVPKIISLEKFLIEKFNVKMDVMVLLNHVELCDPEYYMIEENFPILTAFKDKLGKYIEIIWGDNWEDIIDTRLRFQKKNKH
jgi:hypothetical protein